MKIAVVGAYGYAGKIISGLLQAENIPFTAVGRALSKLVPLKDEIAVIKEVIAIDISEDEDLEEFVEEFDCIINCAGPFTEESGQLLRAVANQKNKIYIDITGEVGFAKASYESHHQTAKENQSLIIHGCAFESMLTDVASRLLKRDMGDINSIQSFYSFKHSKPSPGTRMSMKLSKYRSYERLKNGGWESIQADEKLKTELSDLGSMVAVPYPLPEVAYAFWNLGAQEAMSYMLLAPEEAMFAGMSAPKEGSIEEELTQLKARKRPGPTEEERQAQEFTLYVQASNNSDLGTVKLSGSDMYLLTAKSVVLVLKEIINSDVFEYGVQSPASVFDGDEKRILEEFGVKMESTDTIIYND